jgi:hypothetical protein
VALVRNWTIPTERTPLVSELSANFLRIEGCRVVSTADPYGRILGFLDQSSYFFFQVALQLYSREWVGHVPDPLRLRKSGSVGNRTRNSSTFCDITPCTLMCYATNRKAADSRPHEVNEFYSIYLILPAATGSGFTQPITEMSTRSRKMFLGSRLRPVRRAHNLTSIREPIV